MRTNMMRKLGKIFRLTMCALLFALAFAGSAGAAITKGDVDAAWKRVATAAGMTPIPLIYEAENAPNAWVKFQSANNYSVHVTQGLMRILNNSDEIAGIMGHEIGHIKCGHYNQGVTRNVGWSLLAALLGKAGGVAEIAGVVGMSLAESGFSREQEVEADDYGMDLAVKAGYNPWGLYNAMKSFKDNGYKTAPSGFNSHPPTDRRLQHLATRAKNTEAKRKK